MKASDLNPKSDYPSFPEFERFGIPLDRVSAEIVLAAQKLRNISGVPMCPSPAYGAWARTDGSKTSRHYAVERLSDAGDLFPANGRLLEVWLHAVSIPEIGGIGLYNDTKGVGGKYGNMMIHIDLRTEPLWWIRDNGKYIYHQTDPQGFWRAFKTLLP